MVFARIRRPRGHACDRASRKNVRRAVGKQRHHVLIPTNLKRGPRQQPRLGSVYRDVIRIAGLGSVRNRDLEGSSGRDIGRQLRINLCGIGREELNKRLLPANRHWHGAQRGWSIVAV